MTAPRYTMDSGARFIFLDSYESPGGKFHRHVAIASVGRGPCIATLQIAEAWVKRAATIGDEALATLRAELVETVTRLAGWADLDVEVTYGR